MRILLVNLHKYVNYSGGIEHVLSSMAKEFSRRGHEVAVVMADEKEGKPFYEIPSTVRFYNIFRMPGFPRVQYTKLDKYKRELLRLFSQSLARNVNYSLLKRGAKALASIIEKENPDVIISFREPTGRLLLEEIKTEIPVISMLHNDPDEIFAKAPKEEIVSLAKSKYIQVLLPSFVGKAKKYLAHDGYVVIPNAVMGSGAKVDLAKEKETYHITTVGRLTGRTKRQHLLIEAFAGLANDFPNWNVEIWGNCEDKRYYRRLLQMISENHLENRVFLRGTKKEMKSVWEITDIFAFPSHHEGFGLALAEALSEGIPAVGYKSCPAVNEIIQDKVNGFLVDDGAEPLQEALRKLMEDKELRVQFGKNAKETTAHYEPTRVGDEWEKLLKKTIAK